MTDTATITTYAIETEDLWRIYKTGTQEVAALRGVNLRIPPAQLYRPERPLGQRAKPPCSTAWAVSTIPRAAR